VYENVRRETYREMSMCTCQAATAKTAMLKLKY
jgi:hypothetical protein